MRLLLLTTDEHPRNGLVQAIEAKGYEVIRATAGGEDLLAAAEHAGRLHAALLSQVALGLGWPRLLRQLRRRIPSLPAVVLLGPEAVQSWRLAILTGAFEALPESASEETVLRAIQKALSYSTGKPLVEAWLRDAGGPREANRPAAYRARHALSAPREFEPAA